MPKLATGVAESVKKAAASSGFTPMDEGRYRARLTKVTAKTAASSGNPMWVWEFEILDEKYKGRKQWNNTVLTDAALWKVGESFAAFGVPEDTDTDELLGCTVELEVSQRRITGGNREGEMGNNIDRVVPDTSPSAVRHRASELGGGGVRADTTGAADPTAQPVDSRF